MLCRVAACVSGDLDVVTKAMYRPRGETARLQIAEAFVGDRINEETLAQVFEDTYRAVGDCLKIRNSYAHAHWLSDSEGQFGFYDLEKIAKSEKPLDLTKMKKTFITEATISKQEIFFVEVLNNLIHLFYRLSGQSNKDTDYIFISPIRRP